MPAARGSSALRKHKHVAAPAPSTRADPATLRMAAQKLAGPVVRNAAHAGEET
jgi:hypothetical protein